MDSHVLDGVNRSLAGVTTRRQMLKLIGGGVAGGLVLASGAADALAQGRPVPGGTMIFDVTSDPLGAFTGTFNVTQFVAQGGQVNAIGTLVGTVTNAAGEVLGNVSELLTLPVVTDSSDGSCGILHLVLGPLDLDLLGLQVHLDQIVADITAQSGAGNLLGNLLCAVANLLNGGSANALATLLNRVLSALG